ncbi:uncharacterized protein LOC119683024 [Teleopsis dalmanni]|uniref:uncharacterized protein LOC119683024 n=1 Tax=Teleopsis dalmanni TaxID=139649 RepID=UPI0018CEF972|nr:uncharacterized protein LOC119683024 [Teleopsis dalmanni]
MGPAVGGVGNSHSNRNEDAYFNEQSINQFRKINKDGCIVKTPTDWREYERCLNGGNTCSESTYRNKHKILQEEAFFLTEQNECKKSMTKKKLEKLRESHCNEGDALSADDDSKDKLS